MEVENLRYLAPIGSSHHSVLLFELFIEGTVVELVDESLRYSHYKGDYVKADGKFKETDWDSLLSDNQASQMYNDFSSSCSQVIDECIPKYKKKNGIRKPKWMTSEVWQQLSTKEREFKRLRSRKTCIRRDKYREERNKATELVLKAKRDYEKTLIKDIKKNKNKFWSYIRSKTKIKENILRVVNETGTLTENDTETASQVNKSFVSVFTKEDPNIPTPPTDYNYHGSILDDIDITEENLHNVLAKLNLSKAVGPDGITPHLLIINCSGSLAKPLTMIFRKSLLTGDVPMAWREANVTPLYKKGSKTHPLNYRPVSLTNVVGKSL